MKSAEIRQAFLDFFSSKGHEVVASSTLVPTNDSTLLFTNAGMVPFKETFLGSDVRAYQRATSSQRCVRAGGKHNDLENVGYTARHHTFFEMLGNFSFGDYFKREAIFFAWELLTVVFKLPPEKLWITVYADDDDAANIWLNEIKVDPARITRVGDKPGKKYESDNFWSMGDTGPCGPCSEIFYDHGPDVVGGPPGTPEEDGDRYIEIWNLVFMQYNRTPDGEMHPLPKPSVDTGMGLERLAAVLQGVHSNYDIDLFQSLIKAAAELTDTQDLTHNSLRVIADHIRSCAFLIADGVLPSNEGRGYVLRRIIRRALRHGHKLGMADSFFHQLVAPLVCEMGEAYPELVAAQSQVERLLRLEEERFAETLDQGMKILEGVISALEGKIIPGGVLFKLYDTYGFPADLTADIARERGLLVDIEGFESEMQGQRERARAASQFGAVLSSRLDIEADSEFVGYDTLVNTSEVVALFAGNEAVDRLSVGQEGMIVLSKTPFYAESGGQVGDRGMLSGEAVCFDVSDTQKQGDGVNAHMGKLVKGDIAVGDKLQAKVDVVRRRAIVLNHSATHLLHAALRQVLGEHVAQKGSLVNAERLRFDFSHFEPMTEEEIGDVECLINEQIRANNEVVTRVMSYDEAVDVGAMALFGEKYEDSVRVLSIGEFSTELCGGVHAQRAGDIGLMKIVVEAGTAAGVRRIEAVTGECAVAYIGETEKRLSSIAGLVKAGRDDAPTKVAQLLERNRKLEKDLLRLKSQLASAKGGGLISQAADVRGLKVLAARLDGVDAKALRETADQLKDKLGSGALVLGSVVNEKVVLIACVTKDQLSCIKAGDLVNHVAQQVGGRGGGRPDMAQAGGNDPQALNKALDSVVAWVESVLSK